MLKRTTTVRYPVFTPGKDRQDRMKFTRRRHRMDWIVQETLVPYYHLLPAEEDRQRVISFTSSTTSKHVDHCRS